MAYRSIVLGIPPNRSIVLGFGVPVKAKMLTFGRHPRFLTAAFKGEL